MLNALGISSCSHLGQQMALLSLLFSETAWHHLMEVSLGLGSTYIPRYLTVCVIKCNWLLNNPVQREEIIFTLVLYRHEERKSMSTERYGFLWGINRYCCIFFSLHIPLLFSVTPYRTFKELSKAEEQLSLCRELCEDLAGDMKKEGLKVMNEGCVLFIFQHEHTSVHMNK